MVDRRSTCRQRVYYGGRLAFHERTSTFDCIVRNYSEGGAKIELGNPAAVPDTVELLIARQGVAYFGRIVWRRENVAGLALHGPRRHVASLPLDIALRLRATERINRQLRAELIRLRSEF
ncbi:MAG: PilZ domain-containing protein [Pseudomonadota bacterium]